MRRTKRMWGLVGTLAILGISCSVGGSEVDPEVQEMGPNGVEDICLSSGNTEDTASEGSAIVVSDLDLEDVEIPPRMRRIPPRYDPCASYGGVGTLCVPHSYICAVYAGFGNRCACQVLPEAECWRRWGSPPWGRARWPLPGRVDRGRE
jgi:hypothetical protein